MSNTLEILGARTHNLKNIDLSLPRNRLLVITGVSGSGKSSLAFDTLFAEGQRRYLETFSAYARQFMGSMERPDVDKIDGLSPVIAIDQKTTGKNPRSTVGTTTEVYDFLRLLYARVAEAYSYETGRKMEKLSDAEILKRIGEQFENQTTYLLAPLIKGRKGHYREEIDKVRKQGYLRARIDGTVVELVPDMKLDRYKIHDIEVVIDRIQVNEKSLGRLTKSVTDALNYGKGSMLVYVPDTEETTYYCRDLMDPETGLSYPEPEPNSFSFNSPYGACPTCSGLGQVLTLIRDALLPEPTKTLLKGAIPPMDDALEIPILDGLKKLAKVQPELGKTPVHKLADELVHYVLYGDPAFDYNRDREFFNETLFVKGRYMGLQSFLQIRYLNASSEQAKAEIEQYLQYDPCPTCQGARLRKESLWFKIDNHNIWEVASKDLQQLAEWLDGLEDRLSERQRLIATELLKEIRQRVSFLLEVGLEYLSLDRSTRSLSGGEAQRIRLATQIGSQLMGVLYILDEPSIGLHQADNARLIRSLHELRDLGNTVLVVEHDRDMMLASDYIVDIGPGAGVHGGRVISQGAPAHFLAQGGLTADYLSGRKTIRLPDNRRAPGSKYLRLLGASGHNLQQVDLEVPLGLFVCITGMSGSGKSSLINQTLYPILHEHSYRFRKNALPYTSVEGLEHIDKVIEIDQKPIGRTPRSNPATYTGLFTFIRQLFTELPESKIRGYKPGRFSFNIKGGRCETCKGAGLQVIEMNFLPDVHVLCPTCRGRRYNRETLEIRYKGKSIHDVLEMTVEDAMGFFESIPHLQTRIQALYDVGLGYVRLGQAATTLSGGEAQRMKIATELSKKQTGKTFYILDEPTTGLHFQDIAVLLDVLNRLVEKGNTVLVIEHNLDVVKVADWVVDLGPRGGRNGGRILAAGTPEAIADSPESLTGQYLKPELVAAKQAAPNP
ncbi:MAG: excinuclease ABC subunit UvrA [Bacteroidetes bacterium]|nr:excinuclease ABC subunit UvrA [Bacteroidota bacterium]